MKTPLSTHFVCDNTGKELGIFETALLDYKVTVPRTIVTIRAEPINDKTPVVTLWEVVGVELDYIDLIQNTLIRVIKLSRVIK